MSKDKSLYTMYNGADCHKLIHEIEQYKTTIDSLQKDLALARMAHEKAESMLKQKTTELALINREFDAFTSSVTHAFRNSIQTISGFSQTLIKFYYDNLDESAKDFLTRIMAGTKKMKAMMDGLSELSRISSHELKHEQVDLSKIALDFCTKLKTLEPNRPVECVIAPSLHAYADRELVKNLFENLLGNAWKCTCKNENARIEFGTIQKNGALVYFIQDNGAGFEMTHATKLFKPFQHIHKEQLFQGQGMGLTFAKRIIDKHGGEIWAEAEKGKGATFFFHFS